MDGAPDDAEAARADDGGGGADEPVPGLARLGWGPRVEALAEELTATVEASATGPVVPGRVIRSDRGWAWVGTDEATLLIEVGTLPSGIPSPVTGDWVLVEPGVPALRAVLPRWSAISRLDPLGHGEQVLAADIDLVLIVHGLDRDLKPGRIERSLLLAWDSGAVPVVAVTKADLGTDAQVGSVLEGIRAVASGVEVLATSTRTGAGLDAVRALFGADRTVVLLGESGGGKSTLVNALLGSEAMATGEVREGDAKGRHTTTSRELLVVPGGGVVIDTPGLRALGLPSGDEAIGVVFADVEALAEGCRFRDCRHRTEPGCAVRAAADAGELDPARLERYLALADEIAASDQAAVERDRERKRAGRILSKAARAQEKLRGPRPR